MAGRKGRQFWQGMGQSVPDVLQFLIGKREQEQAEERAKQEEQSRWERGRTAQLSDEQRLMAIRKAEAMGERGRENVETARGQQAALRLSRLMGPEGAQLAEQFEAQVPTTELPIPMLGTGGTMQTTIRDLAGAEALPAMAQSAVGQRQKEEQFAQEMGLKESQELRRQAEWEFDTFFKQAELDRKTMADAMKMYLDLRGNFVEPEAAIQETIRLFPGLAGQLETMPEQGLPDPQVIARELFSRMGDAEAAIEDALGLIGEGYPPEYVGKIVGEIQRLAGQPATLSEAAPAQTGMQLRAAAQSSTAIPTNPGATALNRLRFLGGR